jgi:hypothetical protein
MLKPGRLRRHDDRQAARQGTGRPRPSGSATGQCQGLGESWPARRWPGTDAAHHPKGLARDPPARTVQ